MDLMKGSTSFLFDKCEAPSQRLIAIPLPFAAHPISMLVPGDPQDRSRHTDSVHGVYWAALWPAALALADALLAGEIELPRPSNGMPEILELGCGLGLVTLAAALAGGPEGLVLATDIEPPALALARENAARHSASERIKTRVLDWRLGCAEKFKLILAADCLYDPESSVELARFLSQALSAQPGAKAIVADPDRYNARNFHYIVREAGLNVRMFKRAVPFVKVLGPLTAETEVAAGTIAVDVNFYEISRDADADSK